MPETRSQSGSISGDSESHDEENGGQNSGEQKRFYLKNISPPGHLKAKADDPNSKTLWLSWKRAWNRYLLLSGINKQPKEKKLSSILTTQRFLPYMDTDCIEYEI